MGNIKHVRKWAGVAAFFLAAAILPLAAHTLPISYVFMVTDQDYVHLELSFNPFELANFTDFDANKNGLLDPEELNVAQERLTREILGHLTLSADGKPVIAETAGLVADADSHHATLRAHYRVAASRATLTLESSLQDITSSSHLSQVNFLRDGKPQLAQLDSQSHKVTFANPAPVSCDAASPICGPTCGPASGRSSAVALAIALGVVILAALRRAKRSVTVAKPESPANPDQPPTP